jgi:mono/diheme cytochrome c family protein
MSTNVYATDFVVKQRVVQFDPNTFLGVQGYYTHGQNLRVQKSQEEDEKLKLLKEQNEILKQMVNALLKGKGAGDTGTLPTKPEEPAVPELESKVLEIYSNKCAKCHGDTKADGGLTLVKDGKLVKDQNDGVELAIRNIVHHRVNGVSLSDGEVRMPKGAPALSNEEVEVLRLWTVDKSIDILNRR